MRPFAIFWKSFLIPKCQFFQPFSILQLVKSLPFYIPPAWKRYPFRVEPPRITHYSECVDGRLCARPVVKVLASLYGRVSKWAQSFISVAQRVRWCYFFALKILFVAEIFDIFLQIFSPRCSTFISITYCNTPRPVSVQAKGVLFGTNNPHPHREPCGT